MGHFNAPDVSQTRKGPADLHHAVRNFHVDGRAVVFHQHAGAYLKIIAAVAAAVIIYILGCDVVVHLVLCDGLIDQEFGAAEGTNGFFLIGIDLQLSAAIRTGSGY